MKRLKSTASIIALAAMMTTTVLSAQNSAASDQDKNLYHDFKIGSQSLVSAIREFSEQADIQVFYSYDLIKKLKTKGLSGKYRAEEGLAHLLQNMDLYLKKTGKFTYAVVDGSEGNGPLLRNVSMSLSEDEVAFYESNLGVSEEDATGGSDRTSFDEIIVTASRRSVSLQDTALSVTAVTPEDFAVGGLVSLRDIIEYTPGVVFTGGSTPIGNTISMRGISSAIASPTVGIYIDDVPIGSRNPFSKGAELALDAMESNIERIEVIKGPQGTLYGSSSIGGVIRYITKDPSQGELSGTAKVDLSTTKEGGFNQTYSGGLSGPIIQDKLGVSVSGYYKDVTGFIDRDASSATGAAENINGFETYGITAKVTANPSDELSLSISYLHTKSEFTGSNVITLSGPPYVPAHGRYVSEEGASVRFGTFSLYSGRLEYEFDGATLISSSSYETRENSRESDEVASLGAYIESFSETGAGSVTSAPFIGVNGTNKFVQEVRLQSDESDTLEWTIGGIYSKETNTNQQIVEGLPINFLLLDLNFPSKLVEYAGFANLTYYVTDKFDVTAGVRVGRVETSVQSIDGPNLIVQSGPPVFNNSTNDTYAFSARYRPHADLSLYARIASGYRPASAALPFVGFPEIIESDTLWSYEVGAKGKSEDAKISYDFALWYMNWTNPQAVIFFGAAASEANSNSDVTAYGLEGSVNFFPVEGLEILTNFAYTNSTLDNDETFAFGALAGEAIPGVPEWTASVRANYDFSLGAGMDGFVGGGLRYVGSRTSGFEGGIGADGNPIIPLIANIDLDDYILADIRAGVVMDNITISLYAKNLFNRYTFVSGRAQQTGATTFRALVTVAEPRTIGVMVKGNF